MIINVLPTSTDNGDAYALLEPLFITWRDKKLEVPVGFRCDGCSVPEFLWGTVSPKIDPRTIRGATAHDYIYRTHPAGWTRKEADELFYEVIHKDGLSWWRSQKAYWGVRIFGGSAWDAQDGKGEKKQ